MSKKSHAAPALETPRLRLRAFSREDFRAFNNFWNEQEVYKYITGKPLSEEENWGRLMRLAGQWPLVGFGTWAIEEKNSGRFIGQAGFGYYRREMDVAMPEPESGWALVGASHGQGLATEAMQAAVNWSDQYIDAPRTACIVDLENLPSQKLAKKLGYILAAETTYKDKPVQLFHRQRVIKPLP